MIFRGVPQPAADSMVCLEDGKKLKMLKRHLILT